MAKTVSALEYESESTSGDRAISINDDKPNGSGAGPEQSSDIVASEPSEGGRFISPADKTKPRHEAQFFADATPAFLAQVRTAEMLRESILRHVRYTLVRPTSELKAADYLKPVSLAIRDRIVDRMLETESRFRHKDAKRLYYLSMEFLMGRLLGDNLSNLCIEELCREVLAGFGIDLDEVLESESDAGLGNGGLGRLAACFLESLAT